MVLIYLLIVCAVFAHINTNISDQEKLQKILDGVFQENRLPQPKTITECFDDITARDWAVVVEHSIARAAYGSLIDYYHLMKIIRHVGKNTPLPVKLCLQGNDQAISLGQRFGFYNKPQLLSMKNKVIRYLALNYRKFRKEVIVLNHEIKDGRFYDAGYQASIFFHQILHKQSLRSKIMNKQVLQDLLSGVFRSNNLDGPVTLISCFDDLTAQNFVSKIRGFISEIIRQSKWTSFEIIKSVASIHSLWSQLSPSTKKCLKDNVQLTALMRKYSVQKRGRLNLLTEIITYFKHSILKAKNFFRKVDTLWRKNEYERIGYEDAEEERRIYTSYKL